MGVWLTGIVILLIVGILLDGWRRMRQGRKDNLKMPSYQSELAQPDDDYTSELPNGGARVVAHRRTEPKIGTDADWETEHEEGESLAARESFHDASAAEPPIQSSSADEHESESATAKPTETEPEPERQASEAPVVEPRIPQQVTLNLDESVPMLMESVESQSESQDESEDEPEPPVATAAVHEPAPEIQKPAPQKRSVTSGTEPDRSSAEEAPEPEEVLIINVMAPAGTYFQGEALQKAIFDQGLRYGSMSIFHRYRDARGGGPVQFSLANMVKPGTFDLDAMESFQTPGVSLFMTLPLEGDSVAAFDLMLATAKTLAETLGGELKDENRSAMTRQTMEHDRQRVLDFVRRQLSRVPG